MNASGPVFEVHDSAIQYRDGSEQKLLDIVSKPDFDEDISWRGRKDWATYYHLSPLRKNLLGWIDLGTEPVDILELGAGCGAVTAGLVQFPNASVVALEGSRARAEVIRARCRTASNLEIHVCDINAFQPNRKFDLVTLIGVLEYAGRYGKEADPFQWLLSRAAEWLKDDGALVIAIENRLGHKYLAGCPEDHYGKPYEGVNGYPNYNGIATFSFPELKFRMEKAGLKHQLWYYPYPDYKLPTAVPGEKAMTAKGFDWLGLLRADPEPNFNSSPAFNEQVFLRDLGQLGLSGPFMNSFLVFASRKGQSLFALRNAGILAARMNIKGRSKQFQTTTIFRAKETGGFLVEKRNVENYSCPFLRRAPAPASRDYKKDLVNLQNILLASFFSGGQNLIATAMDQWTALLDSRCIPIPVEQVRLFEDFSTTVFGRPLYPGSGEWLPGELFDLVPANILVHPEADIVVPVDLEWETEFPLPKQFVFDRGWAILQREIARISPFWRKDLHPDSGLPVEIHSVLLRAPLFRGMDRQAGALVESWFRAGLEAGRFDNLKINAPAAARPEPEADAPPADMGRFLQTVTGLAETDAKAAVEYFRRHRSLFGQSPELGQFDLLMEKLKGSI